MSILKLIYISDATKEFSDEELQKLLEKARRKNRDLAITGMMIYAGGKFFQVLEGEPERVNRLLEKIEQDPRHNKIVVMSTELGEERNFGEWSMGFVRSDAQTVAKQLDGYLEIFDGNKLRVDEGEIKGLQVNILLKAFERIITAEESV